MKMKAKVMNLMPLEGFEVKKSWGVTVGLGGVSPILGRLQPEVGGKSRGKTAYGAVSFSRPRAHFSRNWVDSNVWYRA